MASGQQHFDALVLGGGSAGCVLAARLSETPERTVCLVEAGPDYGAHGSGRWPEDLLDATAAPRSHDWDLDVGLRAKVIGGCSAQNACFIVRGEPSDYDEWAARGNPGWSFTEFEPYLRRARDAIGARRVLDEEINPWQRAVLDGAAALGIPVLDDLDDASVTTAIAPVPCNRIRDVRWNAAFAYLDLARERPNLSVLDHALIDRLRLRAGRARGAVIRRDAQEVDIDADVVVLAAGAYGSPAILLRSGVGPAAELRRLSIGVETALDGVGRNLIDHAGVSSRFTLDTGMSEALARHAAHGPLFTDQCVLKAASRHEGGRHTGLHIVPRTSPSQGGCSLVGEMSTFVLKPRSSGGLRLRSADPLESPEIFQAYATDAGGHDLAVLQEGLTLGAEIMQSTPLLRACQRDPQNGDDEASLRARVKGYDHPVGTCRMGPADDGEAVTDTTGRVHALDNVYVADASIMPTIPRANTNLTVLALAERIADRLTRPYGASVRPGL